MRLSETKLGNGTLWTLQALLALLYLFAGVTKLLMPLDVLAQQSQTPGIFMKLIGVCEVAGALGLILPGMLRKSRLLTPLAAAGLAIIMVGATSLTIARIGVAPALLPLVAGLLDAVVAYARWPRAGTPSAEAHPAE